MPAETPPPRNVGGRPRKHVEPLVDLRVRLPDSLHRDLAAAVAANPTPGWSLNDEVIARCTPARQNTDQGAQS